MIFNVNKSGEMKYFPIVYAESNQYEVGLVFKSTDFKVCYSRSLTYLVCIDLSVQLKYEFFQIFTSQGQYYTYKPTVH